MKQKSLISLLFVIIASSSSSIFLLSHAHPYRKPSRKRLQGGAEPRLGEFPYTVALQHNEKTRCTGAIIDANHVISAAHCLVDDKNEFFDEPLQIVAGTIEVNARGRVTINVERVYVPKEYLPGTTDRKRLVGDVAVLKLSEPLKLGENSNLGKVELPKNGKNDYTGVTAQYSGFGTNEVTLWYDPKQRKFFETDKVMYDRMRYANADVVSNIRCNMIYSPPVESSHLCASVRTWNPKKPEGLCDGDSGAPLVLDGVLIGVANNRTQGCNEFAKPAIYLRVSSHLDFIKKALLDKVDSKIRVKDLPEYAEEVNCVN